MKESSKITNLMGKENCIKFKDFKMQYIQTNSHFREGLWKEKDKEKVRIKISKFLIG
jgi:hypothetical protein